MRTMRLSFVFLLAVGALAFPQKSHRDLRYLPLRELQLPKVERHVLPNGMVLYLVEDHRLPIIDAAALIRVGSRHEPADQVGLAEITGAVMRTGGTARETGDQIDEELESIAASVEISIGATMGNASMSVLKEDIDQGLSALADVLMHPAFPEEKIELEKLQHRTAIARRNDDVGEIADREFEKLIYGSASPYARTTEYATIDHIQRADLVAFHQKYFRPNNVLMGIWGDFETGEMKAKVEKAFQDWKTTPVDLPPVPEVQKEWKASIHFIRKEDVNQTNLRLGHVGGQRNDADYHALNVMGRILGGGFSSRLFRHVRSDMGLAYAVGGGWSAEYDYPGTFRVICNTKSESTVAAAQAIQAEIRQMTEVPVTDQELRVAKDAILNSFVFNFDTTGKIVNRLLTYEYFGYPADYLQTFKANVEKVTKDDILRVAKQYLHPDRLVILAVGRDKDFDKPLSTLGPVQTLDIAIPEPKPAEKVADATPESLARGAQVLTAAAQAVGGAEKLQGIRDMVQEFSLQGAGPQGPLTFSGKQFLVLPDKYRQDLQTPFGEMSTAYDGKTGWTKAPQGTGDMPEPQLKEMKSQLARNTLVLFRNASDPAGKVQHLEQAEVDGKPADVVLVTDGDGNETKLFVDAQSHLVLKKSYRGRGPTGPLDVEELFSDYREVSGILLPFKVVVLHNGSRAAEVTTTRVNLNSGVDPAVFRKSP